MRFAVQLPTLRPLYVGCGTQPILTPSLQPIKRSAFPEFEILPRCCWSATGLFLFDAAVAHQRMFSYSSVQHTGQVPAKIVGQRRQHDREELQCCRPSWINTSTRFFTCRIELKHLLATVHPIFDEMKSASTITSPVMITAANIRKAQPAPRSKRLVEPGVRAKPVRIPALVGWCH